MKSTRLLETASSQSICVFCLSRLQSRPIPPSSKSAQHSRITSSHNSQKPPGEAVAEREDVDYSGPPAPQQSPPRWGRFASSANISKPVSFPDPDISQPEQKCGSLAARSSTGAGTSFPDPDIPQGLDQSAKISPSMPRPSPRWDEPAKGDSSGVARRVLGSERLSGGQRENLDSRGYTNQHFGKRPPRPPRPKYTSASTRGQGLDKSTEASTMSKPGWGRHLQPRRVQSVADDGPRITFQSIGTGANNPEAPQAAEQRVRVSRSSNSSREWNADIGERWKGGQNSGTRRFVGFRNDMESITFPKDNDNGKVGREKATMLGTSQPAVEEHSKGHLGRIEGSRNVQSAMAEVEPDLVTQDRRTSRGNMEKKSGRADDLSEPTSFNSTPRRREKGEVLDRRQQKFKTSQYEDDDVEDAETKARKERKKKRQQEKLARQAAPIVQTIELPPFISVANLATALRVRLESFVEKLEELGYEEIANDHVLNFENSSLIAMEYNFEAQVDRSETEDLKARPPVEDTSLLPQRPPIVTIMGHVDHGKTTLLDYLRKSSVAASEHGGITQHIGAFSVPMASGKVVTFLDTPGHAAFLSMRQRGANVTDIIVLVVAADDSVKPQTVEAIKHAKSAKVPIIVAINKVDKDEADVQRVKQDLLRYEIEVEDFGGDVQAIAVSGKTGLGLDELEEALVAQAETIDMRAETDGAAEGWVLEATTKAAGRVATVLVRRGTLRPGDVIVAGTTWARVRTLKNEAGIQVEEAGPGTPVEVDGWRDQPMAGDEVLEAPNEQRATSAVRFREARLDREQAAKDMEAINEIRRLEAERREREKTEKEAAAAATKAGNESTAEVGPKQPTQSNAQATTAKESKNTELYFLIKADVSGSAEAIESSLTAIPLASYPVSLSILRTGVGPISEFDVDHVAAVPTGKGFLVSFNQAVPPNIAHQAERAGVKILDENIIYKVIDNVRTAIEDHLPPLISKRVTGEAEAAQVFDINVGGRKSSKIAGCKIRNGSIGKGKKVRVFRGGMDDAAVVYEGTINSLKSQKKDVTEMRKGTECGMGFENWEEFEVGDIIQCYEEKSERRRLL